jgi:DNA (cytosine-5)-methyltransferase 1
VIYFNENDAYAAQWLRNLWPHAAVDEASIVDLTGEMVAPFAHRAHFFAGIGGWEYALTLAEWPADRQVWTGSPPCQSLSSARRGRTAAIDLWPVWLQLIASVRPRTIFGEQIAQAGAWQDRLCNDLEGLDYAVGTAILPACSVGQDHVRSRFYFVGHTNREGQPKRPVNEEVEGMQRHRRVTGELAQTDGLPNRMAQLRAYGNAIVPPLAAQFILAFLEAEHVRAR